MSGSFFDDKPIVGPFDKSLQDVPRFHDAEGEGRASQQRRWEHRVTTQLLKHYGLTGQAREMVSLLKQRTGSRRLSLEAFCHFHPRFPMWLGARKIPYVHEITMERFAREYTKTPLYKAFSEVEADAPDGYERAGLVFEWLHVWPTAIMHNYYHAIQVRGLVLFYQIPGAGELMAIQSLDSFLDSLPWQPDQVSV